MYSALSTLNTTTEVPLIKAPNPQLLPGCRSINGCPLLRVCVHGVSVFTAVCVHFGWVNAEHELVKMAPVYVACRLASLLLCVVSVFLSVSNCYSPLVYDRQLLLDIKDSVVTTYNSELASSVVNHNHVFQTLSWIFLIICADGILIFPGESVAGDAGSAEGLLSN